MSERTQAFQRQLLVASSLLILLRFSLVSVTGDAEVGGFKVSLVANTAFFIACATTAYLELLVMVRSRLDWGAWKIRVGAAESYLHALDVAAQSSLGSSQSNEQERANNDFIDAASRDYEVLASAPRATTESTSNDVAARPGRNHERELLGHYIWIRERVAPLRRLNTARGLVELVFPVAYGAVALALAVSWFG